MSAQSQVEFPLFSLRDHFTVILEKSRQHWRIACLEERVGPVQLRLSSTAFFQVNRDVAARIYDDLAQAAALTGQERVVDAYAGVGGIAEHLGIAPSRMVGR